MNSYVTNHTAQSPSTTAKANLNGIDLVKFICAILVFMVHCVPFKGQISPIADNINTYSMNCLCRIAVPFYFVCSGFFLFRKMPLYELNVDTIKHYCYKILRLTAAYFLFCLAYNAPLKDHRAYRCLRNTGMLFYFIHLFILRFFIFS